MKPNPALGMVILKVRGGVNSESNQKPLIRHVFLYPTFEAGKCSLSLYCPVWWFSVAVIVAG